MKTNPKQSFPHRMKRRVFCGRNIAAVAGALLPVLGCAVQAANPYAWGYNFYGQLGDGTTTNRTTPVAADMSGTLLGESVTAIAAGGYHTVALASDAKVFAWGYNRFGQLGDGTTTNRTTPVAVDMSGALLGKTVIAVAAGYYHTVALTSDGKVFAWGNNGFGQLGDGTTIDRRTPVPVDMSGALLGKTVTAIAAGDYHTVALTSDGKVFAWGANDVGQLGDGTAADRLRPVAVDMSGVLRGKTVSAIAAGGYYTVALTSDGKVFAWGANDVGQLGDGTHTHRSRPVAADMSGALLGKTVTAIAAGGYHTVALTSDGKVFAWGYNVIGQLGDGTTISRRTPVAVDMTGSLMGKSVTAIAAGGYHTVALTFDGKVFAWGFNRVGQLGDGTTTNRSRPVAVGMSGALLGKTVSAIAAGHSYTVALAISARLGNISTRAFVQTGDNVMIGGFIVEGTEPKRVIIRAIGPDLTRYGVPNALANPMLELHDGTGALIASNNNWATTIIGGIITANQVHDIQASGYAPGDGRESAIIADLPPGNYTAIVRGVDNMTGVGLVEVYDLSGDASSILGNISTRSFVQTGDNVMIGGFIVEGMQPKRVIIRAIGPELSAPPFNIPDALADPTLELHDHTGALIGSNDNWQHTIIGGIITSSQVHDITNSGHAPSDPRESAIIAELPSGSYTAIVRGVNNTTGVALVEVYDLE
jgi:alpha-tubulin suppressor-like RCC1 family protein